MSIKHLVLSGGGPSGIATCGVLDQMLESKYLCIDEIETIHATSIGSVNAVFLCLHKLGIEYESIRDYIFKRPFHETYKINVQNILNLYEKKGIYNISIAEVFFKPFFNALNISIDITMLEFYELTKIELYFYAIHVNSFQLEELSYMNTPELSVIHAIYMSSTVPILFSPHIYKESYYIDGGFMSNYPIQQSIHRSLSSSSSRETEDKILGIYYQYSNMTTNGFIHCEPNSNIIHMIVVISYNMISYLNKILSSQERNTVKNVIEFPIQLSMTYSYIQSLFCNEKTRMELYNNGYNQAKKL